jgi:hypothetical protein
MRDEPAQSISRLSMLQSVIWDRTVWKAAERLELVASIRLKAGSEVRSLTRLYVDRVVPLSLPHFPHGQDSGWPQKPADRFIYRAQLSMLNFRPGHPPKGGPPFVSFASAIIMQVCPFPMHENPK